MYVIYHSDFAPYWGYYPPDILDREDCGTVGGGEAGMLNTAFQLSALGHRVLVFSCGQSGEYKGVKFLQQREIYNYLLDTNDKPDAVVCWTLPSILPFCPNSVLRIFSQQLNDLSFPIRWFSNIDVIVSPSQNHLEFMKVITPVKFDGKYAVVHNGVFLENYENWLQPKDRPLRVGYWSSPDRGLHHVLQAWKHVHNALPNAELRVYYEINRLYKQLENSREQGWFFKEILVRMLYLKVLTEETRDMNVTYVGAIPRKVLAREQVQCRIMVYPSDGIAYTEGFSTAVAESCAAGCLPILRPADALPSLYENVAWWLPYDFNSELLAKYILEGLLLWTNNPVSPTLEQLRQKAEQFTWANAGKEIEKVIMENLR